MMPPLPTDDDTSYLFDWAVRWLRDFFGYSAEEANSLAREYYVSFRDPIFCRSVHLPVHDDDMFHHQRAGDLAMRIHYYMGLKADPDPKKYLDWRTEYYRNQKASRKGPAGH